MICSLISMLCVVGGMEIGPAVYKMEFLDLSDGTIHEVVLPAALKDRVFEGS